MLAAAPISARRRFNLNMLALRPVFTPPFSSLWIKARSLATRLSDDSPPLA